MRGEGSGRGLGRAVRTCAAAFAVALLAACSTSGPPDIASSAPLQTQTTAAAPLEKKAPVKVALLVPLSAQGHSGVIGKALKQAAELAIFERDNPNLQLIVKDDKGTPEGARGAAEEAIKSGATLVLGPLFAKSVAAAAPIARQANVPIVAFSNDRQVAGNGVYLLSFQPAPETARIVGYALQQGKRRFVALIPDDTFGKVVEPTLREAVTRGGGTVIAVETYPASANAMLEPMRKISTVIRVAEDEGAPIDALFVPGGQENLEMIGRLLPQAEIDTTKVKLLGTGGMDYPNAGRDARLVGAWYPAPDPSGWTDFSQKYAKSYGQAPPRIASLAYDAVSLAIALAGGDTAAQRYTGATLTRSTGFTGVDGAFRLRADGTTERALAVLEVQKFGAGVVDAPGGLQRPQPEAMSGAGALPDAMRNLFNFN